jgi:hypothetical protein
MSGSTVEIFTFSEPRRLAERRKIRRPAPATELRTARYLPAIAGMEGT